MVLATGDVLDIERGVTFAHPDGYFELASPVEPFACRSRVPDARRVEAVGRVLRRTRRWI